jgi:3-hydroxyacyl-CoA dehydrogenase
VARFFVSGQGKLPEAELLIECVAEQRTTKQKIAAQQDVVSRAPLRATVSSSLLPGDVDPGWVGWHFFYPLVMTRLVEVIYSAVPTEIQLEATDWLRRQGLTCIEQDSTNAFVLNQLLLPVQNECARELLAGQEPTLVNRASSSDLVPQGHLALMDSIGLDVVAPAVENLTARMDHQTWQQYEPLRLALASAVAAGKRGRKNKNGFLSGDDLPWPLMAPAWDEQGLTRRLRCLQVNSCWSALEEELISSQELSLALESLFSWVGPLAELLDLSCQEGRELLLQAWQEQRCSYFWPASAWSGERLPLRRDWRNGRRLL